MADIHRVGKAVWNGDLRSGNGTLGSESGTLQGVPYSFATRFGEARGTNPEELVAAAHAACYSMALANYITSKGIAVRSIATKATCTLSVQPGGAKIVRMRLDTTGDVPGVSAEAFAQLAQEGEKVCPVSNALRGGIEIEVHATLRSE